MPRAAPTLPAVFLYPADDDLSAFEPKLLSLGPPGARAQIARACKDNSAKQVGTENGFIQSYVLSRLHAELWADGRKIYIKDTKSTHGTYLNGERLSAEGVESVARELGTGDSITFAIDVFEADMRTVKYAKPSVKVICIFTPKDYDQFSVQHPGF